MLCSQANPPVSPSSGLAELRMGEFELVFRINVFDTLFCAREAAKRLSARNGGGRAIVSMSSAIAINTGAPSLGALRRRRGGA